MINKPLDPKFFNIDVITLKDEDVKLLGEVSKANIFEPTTNRFEPKGLYSTEIFGPVGSPTRNSTLGYINLRLDILHPYVFNILCSLNSKYEDVMASKIRVKFDNVKKDIVEDKDGETGYGYFLSIFPKIVLNDNGSVERKSKITFVKKYVKPEYMSNKLLVLPAGLRDYRVDESNNPVEDEVNKLYRKLLSITSLISTIKLTPSTIEQLDPTRYKLQKAVLEVFNYFLTLINGKSKFIEDKWSKRAITNGTRNVITPAPYKINNLKKENKITTNHTVVGLYQYIKAIAPITMNRVITTFSSKFMSPETVEAKLVSPTTKRTNTVRIKPHKRDEWFTMEGLNKLMNKMAQPELRNEPVMVDGYYLMLVHDTGDTIKLYYNTNEVVDEELLKELRPITYAEMFYISIYPIKDKYPGFVTRYPVIELGSIYPCKIYVKTTFEARTITLIDRDGERTLDEYPILGYEYMESTSPSAQHLAKLGADYLKVS